MRFSRSRSPLAAGLSIWLQAFLPSATGPDWRERLRVVAGAGLGVLFAGWSSHLLAGDAWPWLVAPLGASAVLVFGVPASPLAQPWAVLAGNTLSALAGVACVLTLGSSEWTAALAVALAIGLMFTLRCLHPPGGASALLVTLAGISDPMFAVRPVLLNSLLLVLVGVVYNSSTRRAYPHPQLPAPAKPVTASDEESRALDADLDAVLARYNQVVDISRDDLKSLLHDTQLRSYQRKLNQVRCADIMSRDPVTVTRRTPLKNAWAMLREHGIKALPVVDLNGGIVGIVTRADLMRAAELDGSEPADVRGRKLAGWSEGVPDTVGDIMTRRVRVVGMSRHLAELMPLFGSTGHHHIPVVDEKDRLVGIITQSDVVAALARIGPDHAA